MNQPISLVDCSEKLFHRHYGEKVSKTFLCNFVNVQLKDWKLLHSGDFGFMNGEVFTYSWLKLVASGISTWFMKLLNLAPRCVTKKVTPTAVLLSITDQRHEEDKFSFVFHHTYLQWTCLPFLITIKEFFMYKHRVMTIWSYRNCLKMAKSSSRMRRRKEKRRSRCPICWCLFACMN